MGEGIGGSRYPCLHAWQSISRHLYRGAHRFVRRRDSPLRLFPSFVHTSVNTYPGLLQAALRTFDPFQHFHTILTSAKRFLASCVSPAARPPSTPPRWIADNFVFEMLTLPAIIDANRHRVYDRWISDSPRGNFELETSKKHRKRKVTAITFES